MRLQTERVEVSKPKLPEGRGFVVLLVRGDYLSINEGPAPVDQKLDGSQVILFQHQSSAAMWAVLSAWNDLADGKPPRAYQIRPVRYRDAVSTYSLKIVEGPIQCTLGGAIEATQFSIPALGLEKPGSTILTRPQEANQQRRPRR